MKKKVIILDDDKSMTKLLEVVLKSDYEALITHTISDALEHLKKGNVQGIVVDLNLEGESGDVFIKMIRADISTWLPIIVLSGKEKSEDRIRCFELGADDYLSKPFNPVELKLRLNRHIEKFGLIS